MVANRRFLNYMQFFEHKERILEEFFPHLQLALRAQWVSPPFMRQRVFGSTTRPGCVFSVPHTYRAMATDDDLELPEDVTYGPTEIAHRLREIAQMVIDDYAKQLGIGLRYSAEPQEDEIAAVILTANTRAAELYAEAAHLDGETPDPPVLLRNQIGHNP